MKEIILIMTLSYYKQGNVQLIDKLKTMEQCNAIGKKWIDSIEEDLTKEHASFVCVEADRYE